MESEAMKMIRKVRDKNSLLHINMSFEERKEKEKILLTKLSKELKSPMKII